MRTNTLKIQPFAIENSPKVSSLLLIFPCKSHLIAPLSVNHSLSLSLVHTCVTSYLSSATLQLGDWDGMPALLANTGQYGEHADSPTHEINSEYTYKGKNRNRKVPHSCSSATSISSVTYRNYVFDSPLYLWPLTHLAMYGALLLEEHPEQKLSAREMGL